MQFHRDVLIVRNWRILFKRAGPSEVISYETVNSKLAVASLYVTALLSSAHCAECFGLNPLFRCLQINQFGLIQRAVSCFSNNDHQLVRQDKPSPHNDTRYLKTKTNVSLNELFQCINVSI